MKRYNDLYHDLQSVYDEYLKNSVDAYSFNIHCFRNIANVEYFDKVYYRILSYYQEDTRNTYEIAALRNKILELCTK